MITINQFTIIGTIAFICIVVFIYLITRKKSGTDIEYIEPSEPLEQWIEKKVIEYTRLMPKENVFYFDVFAQGYNMNHVFTASIYLVEHGFFFYWDDKRCEVRITVTDVKAQQIKNAFINQVYKDLKLN